MENYPIGREMRTVVKDKKIIMERSEKWSTTGIIFGTKNVSSIYVNDMPEGISSYISIFA